MARRSDLARAVFASLLSLAAAVAADRTPVPDRKALLAMVERLPAGSGELQAALQRVAAGDAAQALGAIGRRTDADARRIAVACFARPEPGVVQAALRALPTQAGVGDDERAAVRALLGHREADVRVGAARCLATLGDRAAIPLLAAGLKDPALADAAHAALSALAKRDLGEDPTAWSEWYAKHEADSAAALAAVGDRLRSSESVKVVAALNDLLLIDADATTKQALIQPCLASGDETIAHTAEQALQRVRGPTPRTADPALASEPRETRRPTPLAVARAQPTVVAAAVKAPSRLGGAMFVGALACGLVGALGMLVFLMRTREAAIKLTQRVKRKTMLIAKGATQRIAKAIKKRITFSS